MKNVFLILGVTLLFVSRVVASTPTASVTATPAPTSKIDDLKERLATKVAELRQTQKKAIFGKVKAVTVSTFTVETLGRDLKIELTDDISVFETIKGKRTKLSNEDIAVSDLVSIFGDFDSELDLLRAKVVVIQGAPLERTAGTVSAIDREAFTVTLTTPGGQEYLVDIEKTTNVLTFDQEKGLVKGGFSKLEPGRIIHVIGTAVAKEDNRISAARLIDLGNLTGVSPTPTPSEEPTPASPSQGGPTATASGTSKATPKPTTKSTPTP